MGSIAEYIILYVRHLVLSDSFRFHGLWPASLLCPWASPGKNTGVGCHALLQRIFPTQGLNLGLPHCRQILYHLRATREAHLFSLYTTKSPFIYISKLIIIFSILLFCFIFLCFILENCPGSIFHFTHYLFD